ncbi:centromere protein T [Lacerta agilis]|uniref:centromere protein T n=1 Tax=Lacerta agilis TaxID=80427 RepID=UPI001419BEF3|nr:centromere protein T [Lacerta agilis]
MPETRRSGRLSATKIQKEAAMATRSSLLEEKLETPRGQRRSLRLKTKEIPFRSMAYQRPGASIYTDLATPQTLFRKVLETQPIISPLVPEKPDSPKPVETVFQAPLKSVPCSNPEIHLSDSAPKATSRTALLNTRSKKKVRLSVFERALDEQLASTHSLLNITSQSESQISFRTPPPLRSAGKKGLVRRPKNYRCVTVKAFEDGIEQNLLQTKGSQSYLVAPSTLSNDSSAQFADTESIAQPELSRQSGAGLSAVHSQLHPTIQSLARESLPSSIETPWQGAENDLAVEGVTQNKGNITHSLLDDTSRTKSQISFRTPPPLRSAGKKGLVRRPKNYRCVTVKAFEDGIEQNLLQTKGCEFPLVLIWTGCLCLFEYYLLAPSTLSNDSSAQFADTESIAQPELSRQSGAGLSAVHSQLHPTRQSLARESLPSSIETPWQGAENDLTVEGVTQNEQKEIFTQYTDCVDGTEAVLEENAANPMEDHQQSLQNPKEGLLRDHQKQMLMQSTEHANGLRVVFQERTVTPERGQQESLHGNSDMEHFLSPENHLPANPVRSSPSDAKLPEAHPGHLHPSLNEKSAKLLVKEMIPHISKELESSVVPTAVNLAAGTHLQEEPFPSERDIQNPQSTTAGTPSRCVSRKRSEQFERLPTKEMEDRTSQETMDDMVSEAEMDSETEEVSETEMDSEKVGEKICLGRGMELWLLMEVGDGMQRAYLFFLPSDLTEKTPAFVRTRVLQCTPLLSALHAPKVAASRSLSKQLSVKQATKPAQRACRGKREPALPRKFVKNVFVHCVKMPVTKDAFKAVENCVDLYFKQLSDDLEAYVNHARRKTIEPADLELLMRRQGLITDKIPLNVLIERHMPLEYRQLLIPVATSGNKVFPPML